MRFVKGNRASVDRLHKDTNVAALQAMAWLKRLLGQRVDVESPTCLALVPTGMGEPPVFKPDGTKYTIMEITPDLVRRHVYRHRNGGLQSDERYYKKGTPKYKHEERVARAVIGWVRELQAAQAGGLYEIRGCSFGQGLIGLRHGSLGDTVCKADGTPLRPMYSRTRSVGREIVCGGKRTQSQVDVHGHGLHQGRTVHLLLCGTAQFINSACKDCATHTFDNWGYGGGVLKQRWQQLLPGTEMTLDYNYTDKKARHPCGGPFCRTEHWQHVPTGASYKDGDGREVVVRGCGDADPTYAGAFAPCTPGEATHTPMFDWMKALAQERAQERRLARKKRPISQPQTNMCSVTRPHTLRVRQSVRTRTPHHHPKQHTPD